LGPWSNSSGNTTNSNVLPQRKASPALVASIVALCLFGAAIVWLQRFEVSSIGPVALRLDRFTGQVIGCVPNAGCVEFVPAGTPEVRDAFVRRQSPQGNQPQPSPNPTPPGASAGGGAAPGASPTPAPKAN
jgi:hypothetical protein